MENYTKEYYQSINNDEAEQAKTLVDSINKHLAPIESVSDLGCGTGLYLQHFKCVKFGCDFSDDAFHEEVLKVDRGLVVKRDLREPYEVPLKSDLALCLEVVEHIGEEYAEILVDNICKYSDLIVMTAAPIGQAGLNHVNCQPQKYWDEKFEKRGYSRDYHTEYQIISDVFKVKHTIWLIRNLMVYKKNG